MNARDATPPRWRIHKVEWDALNEPTRRSRLVLGIVIGVQVFGGALCIVVAYASARHLAGPSARVLGMPMAWIGGVTLALALAQVVFISIARPRWRRLRPVIWRLNGCVCPWCRAPVDALPCRRHGFSADDETALRAYWEALATHDSAELLRTVDVLHRVAKRTPMRAVVLAPVRAALARHTAAMQAERITPFRRLRLSAAWVAIQVGVILLVGGAILLLVERQMAVALFSGCWFLPVMCVISALWGVSLRPSELRCTKCGYACIAAQPRTCTECGADLTQVGALTRRARVQLRHYALLFGPMVVLLIAGPWFGRALLLAVPTGVRNHVWAVVGPPRDYYQSLVPAHMSSDEVCSAFELLVAAAAPGGPRVFDGDFLQNARAAGKVTDEMLERAARATVQARLTIEVVAGNATATVRPMFGTLIFGSQQTPRLAFGGVSVDGGPWSAPAAWSLFLHDTDSTWRSFGVLPVLPESQLVFSVPLGVLAPGTHTVRARCWAVVWGAQWVRMTPEFDANGVLIAPTGAWGVYDMVLTEQVDIR